MILNILFTIIVLFILSLIIRSILIYPNEPTKCIPNVSKHVLIGGAVLALLSFIMLAIS